MIDKLTPEQCDEVRRLSTTPTNSRMILTTPSPWRRIGIIVYALAALVAFVWFITR